MMMSVRSVHGRVPDAGPDVMTVPYDHGPAYRVAPDDIVVIALVVFERVPPDDVIVIVVAPDDVVVVVEPVAPHDDERPGRPLLGDQIGASRNVIAPDDPLNPGHRCPINDGGRRDCGREPIGAYFRSGIDAVRQRHGAAADLARTLSEEVGRGAVVGEA